MSIFAGKTKIEFLENPNSTLLGYSRIYNLIQAHFWDFLDFLDFLPIPASYFKKIEEELGLFFLQRLQCIALPSPKNDNHYYILAISAPIND